MDWMCNYRFMVVFVILVIFLILFFMSEQFQTFFRKQESFMNNELSHCWEHSQVSPEFKDKWFTTESVATREKWYLNTMFSTDGRKFDHKNCSVSFWIFMNSHVGHWGHIFSIRSDKVDRYLGIWKRPWSNGMHIRSTLENEDDEEYNHSYWNSGESHQGETGHYNQNDDHNHIIGNVPVFIVITIETPEASKAQLKQNKNKTFDSTYRLYVNGQKKNTFTHPSSIKSFDGNDNPYIMIGRKWTGSKAYKAFGLKDIKLYNTSISSVNVESLYSSVRHKSQWLDARNLFEKYSEGFVGSIEGFQNKTINEGFVTKDQCNNVYLPDHKAFFDFYKNMKMLRASGGPCKYSYTDDMPQKQIVVGPSGGPGPKIVDLNRFNIGIEEEINPRALNKMNSNWNDTFRLERDGHILKVYRTDTGNERSGWGMNLVLGTVSKSAKIDDSRFKCSSNKPICVDYIKGKQYGHCGRDQYPFEVTDQKVRFWQHNRSGWKVDMGVGRIPNLVNHNGINMNGLSTIEIPDGLKVVIFDQTDFNGNGTTLIGPQTIRLWTQSYNSVNYNDKVRSLKVKSTRFQFKKTYIIDNANPIVNEDDWRLDKEDLEIEDTLETHFPGENKTMRFITFNSNMDWRKKERATTNMTYKEARDKTRGGHFERVEFRNLDLYFGENGITFCMWFKMKPDNERWSRLMDFGDGYALHNVVILYYGKQIKFSVHNNGEGRDTKDRIIQYANDGNWYHISWVLGKPNKEGKCQWKIYVNSSCVSTIEDQNYIETGESGRLARKNLYLGASNYWWDPHLNGSIADFRMYQEPLTAAQVCKVYNNPDENGPK